MSYFVYFPCFGSNSEPNLQEENEQPQHQQQSVFTFNNMNTFGNSNSYFSYLMGPQSLCALPSDYQLTDAPQPTASSIPSISPPPPKQNKKRKREKNPEKEIESAKKNGQSNLINHFFSFFSNREKSEGVVEQAIGSVEKEVTQKQKIFHIFYSTIHLVNAKRGRKYVNRTVLFPLLVPAELEKFAPEITQKIEKMNNISMENLCQVFRKCIFYFYRSTSIELVLTSRRISDVAKEQHLKRRRRIRHRLFAQIF